MSHDSLYNLFIMEIEDIYNFEKQIIEELPNLIKAATHTNLKEALRTHLTETRSQVQRLERVFNILREKPRGRPCGGMEGILEEGSETIQSFQKGSTRDAAIISAAQKVEHYEITSYGSVISHAKCLELDSEITALLGESIDEEENADKTLTKIAKGSIFSSGINQEACEDYELVGAGAQSKSRESVAQTTRTSTAARIPSSAKSSSSRNAVTSRNSTPSRSTTSARSGNGSKTSANAKTSTSRTNAKSSTSKTSNKKSSSR